VGGASIEESLEASIIGFKGLRPALAVDLESIHSKFGLAEYPNSGQQMRSMFIEILANSDLSIQKGRIAAIRANSLITWYLRNSLLPMSILTVLQDLSVVMAADGVEMLVFIEKDVEVLVQSASCLPSLHAKRDIHANNLAP